VTSLRYLRHAVVAVALLAGAAAPARADFVLDDFTTPNPATSFIPLGGTVGATTSRTDIFGGITRDILVTQTANSLGTAGGSQYLVGTTNVGGRLALATAPYATANVSVNYAYASPQNLSAGGTALQMHFDFADFGVPFSVAISDGTHTSTQSGSATSGSGIYSLNMSSFSGVDLTHVSNIDLLLNGGSSPVTSADFALSEVVITTPTPVPAPPAALLAMAALPVLSVRRMLVKTAA
jgi:hypothetical protein